ncbi:hypothetical protein [Microscilla marina]|uniref:Uncharacterized protein n=1 Tax=Microscilla marina ATCC 23134 TaxID=313606 RepID=A1ZT59_MICM2|nr:hypothetical protein [Microscilla marina]EAY26449.1 hypothetical protein M23134_07044 [Microscilla marina ATCC 23134]
MTEHQTPENENLKEFQADKIKSKHFACRIWGHDWQGNSLKRTCTRCKKTQTAKFTTNIWVDVES